MSYFKGSINMGHDLVTDGEVHADTVTTKYGEVVVDGVSIVQLKDTVDTLDSDLTSHSNTTADPHGYTMYQSTLISQDVQTGKLSSRNSTDVTVHGNLVPTYMHTNRDLGTSNARFATAYTDSVDTTSLVSESVNTGSVTATGTVQADSVSIAGDVSTVSVTASGDVSADSVSVINLEAVYLDSTYNTSQEITLPHSAPPPSSVPGVTKITASGGVLSATTDIASRPVLLGPSAGGTTNAVPRFDSSSNQLADSLLTVTDTGDVHLEGGLHLNSGSAALDYYGEFVVGISLESNNDAARKTSTQSVHLTRVNNLVTLSIPIFSCSTASASAPDFYLPSNPLPSAYRPIRDQSFLVRSRDDGVYQVALMWIPASGMIYIYRLDSTTAWSATGSWTVHSTSVQYSIL